MILRWLYTHRMRKLFAAYMQPAVFDAEIVPLLQVSERQAFRGLISSFFPAAALADAQANDVVALRNQIARMLQQTAAPSNSTPHTAARDVPASASTPGARAGGRER